VSIGFDLSQTDHLLTTTRAVRKRLDFTRPVEPKVLLDCIQIATQAPSGANAQRWRWIVVTDPERKAIVAHYPGPCSKESSGRVLRCLGSCRWFRTPARDANRMKTCCEGR
jgi:hypothetical protein